MSRSIKFKDFLGQVLIERLSKRKKVRIILQMPKDTIASYLQVETSSQVMTTLACK
jgi:hypothetical protein